MHYVIGDIHGCYQDMMALLNKIESQDQDAQIIFVGDFIDLGLAIITGPNMKLQRGVPDI